MINACGVTDKMNDDDLLWFIRCSCGFKWVNLRALFLHCFYKRKGEQIHNKDEYFNLKEQYIQNRRKYFGVTI